MVSAFLSTGALAVERFRENHKALGIFESDEASFLLFSIGPLVTILVGLLWDFVMLWRNYGHSNISEGVQWGVTDHRQVDMRIRFWLVRTVVYVSLFQIGPVALFLLQPGDLSTIAGIVVSVLVCFFGLYSIGVARRHIFAWDAASDSFVRNAKEVICESDHKLWPQNPEIWRKTDKPHTVRCRVTFQDDEQTTIEYDRFLLSDKCSGTCVYERELTPVQIFSYFGLVGMFVDIKWLNNLLCPFDVTPGEPVRYCFLNRVLFGICNVLARICNFVWACFTCCYNVISRICYLAWVCLTCCCNSRNNSSSCDSQSKDYSPKQPLPKLSSDSDIQATISPLHDQPLPQLSEYDLKVNNGFQPHARLHPLEMDG